MGPNYNQDDDEERLNDDSDNNESEESSALQKMKNEYPGYTEESYKAGRFIGLNFPYVPGDPGL